MGAKESFILLDIAPWLNSLNCNSVGGDAQDTVILYPHLATMYRCRLVRTITKTVAASSILLFDSENKFMMEDSLICWGLRLLN